MRTFRAWVFGGLALMALAALIAGWMINRALMGRLARMSDTAREIMAGDLSHRMPVTASNDEFDALAADLNAMLDRIERQTRFTEFYIDVTLHLPSGADAHKAHRLCEKSEQVCLVTNSLTGKKILSVAIVHDA